MEVQSHFVSGDLVDADLIAEGKGYGLWIEEQDWVGFGIAVGGDMSAVNLHVVGYKRNNNNQKIVIKQLLIFLIKIRTI